MLIEEIEEKAFGELLSLASPPPPPPRLAVLPGRTARTVGALAELLGVGALNFRLRAHG